MDNVRSTTDTKLVGIKDRIKNWLKRVTNDRDISVNSSPGVKKDDNYTSRDDLKMY